MFEAAQHQGKRGQSQIRFGFSATGRKKEKIDHVAVRMMRVRNAWQVHEQKRQLERSPTRLQSIRVFSLHDAQALPGRTRHGPIGDAKSRKDLRIGQQCNALLDTVGRHTGTMQQLVGNVAASCRRSRDGVVLPINPVSILRHKRAEFGVGIRGVPSWLRPSIDKSTP